MSYTLTQEKILEIKNVSLSFGSKLVLNDINVEIFNAIREGTTTGQVIGFLGPSGRGKTQLFKIIAGLNKPTSGEVLLHGAPVKRGEVGVVGQSYPLFRNKTVIQNLRSVPHGNNKKDLEDKISFYLDRLRIADLKNSFPINLSGGQRQRVAIVQQMLCSEHFLLLDEPFASLDPLMTQEVCRLIDDIANASDLHTVIVVSHDITSTVAISTELWLLGYDHDEAGNPIPENGARIKYKEDLMKMGLAWEFPGIYENPKFLEFVKDIRMTFRKL